MLSNAYFLAKFRFDTAENEPAKNLQNFAKFVNFADPNPLTLVVPEVVAPLVEEAESAALKAAEVMRLRGGPPSIRGEILEGSRCSNHHGGSIENCYMI